ncbi:MAG TPA: molybdopterin molybdotransferase MoeA [Methanocellaceae archaeon]
MAKNDSGNVMVSLDTAYEIVDGMRAKFYDQLPREKIHIDDSLFRRLASDIISAERSPSRHISTMDGYAVKAGEAYPLQLIGEVFAGEMPDRIGAGKTVYITTGAALPDGADAVLRIEDAKLDGERLYGLPMEQWTSVIKAGSDFEVGDRILQKGTCITPAMIGLLHAAGADEVEVYQKPRIAVISTGDEIRNGMTKNTNAPTACALLKTWGCSPESLDTVRDAYEDTVAALDDASSRYDAIVTIGGVSVGKKDFVVKTIVEGGDVVFHGYMIRPGKPLLVSYYRGKPVFSLPGKPTGAFTAMELIVSRFLRGELLHAGVCLPVSRDLEFSKDGFEYIVYVNIVGEKAVPMGFTDSPLKLFEGPKYGVSIVSSSPRSMVCDGFFRAKENMKAGTIVNVQLL